MEERDWQAPEAPGEISRGSYVIPSPDDHYGPWVIGAIPPRKRDFWKVLRGKWKPEVYVTQRLTLKGTNRVIKSVYTHERLTEQLADSLPLPFKS
jgi:hypothetical protein